MKNVRKFPEIFTDNDWYKKIETNKPGKTVAILGAIHGNEKVGIEVIKKINEQLNIDNGTVYLVGGNPQAYEKNVRFVEENLNRVFETEPSLKKSYERGRAELIKEILNQCDAVFDIHQQQQQYQKKNIENFMVCEPTSAEWAKKFNTESIIFSEDAGCTDKYMDALGKIGLCYEAGNIKEKNQQKNIDLAYTESIRFLQITKNLVQKIVPDIPKNPEILPTKYVYFVQENFLLDQSIEGFDTLSAVQLIGIDGSKKIFCPEKYDGAKILFPGSNNIPDTEAFSLALTNS